MMATTPPPDPPQSVMFREAAEAPTAVRAQLNEDPAVMRAVGAAVRRLAPRAVVTCARGSSDHAATYAKYLIETHARTITASAAPSVNSLYGIAQDLRGCLFIAISQSGRSPDLLAAVASARASGATILALCNSPASPLAGAADLLIDLHAGAEQSVAATKSFLATLAALARLVAAWTLDTALAGRIEALPALLERSWNLDWSAALPGLLGARNLYVLGRGFGLGAAQEVALKFKETCGLHAEAFSSAELRHGPLTLVGPEFPTLVLSQADATRPGVEALAAELAGRGVPVLLAAGPAIELEGEPDGNRPLRLPTVDAPAEIAPILLVQSAYRLIATLAPLRGFDPDQPRHLHKVTETL